MEVALDHSTSSSDDESSSGSEKNIDVEDGLKARKRRHQSSGGIVPALTKPDISDEDPSENTAYLDKYGGAIEDLNIQKLANTVTYGLNENGGTEIETPVNGSRDVREEKSEHYEEEITEEEVVELEFENAIPKLNTHMMHCPNCDHHITRVVLRRKIIKRKPPVTEQRVTEQRDEPVDLLGCFSCFSLFTSTDNGGFNPFPIFGNKPTSSVVPGAEGNDVVREDGNCFSIFRVFRRENDSKQPKPGKVGQESEEPAPGNVVDKDSAQPKPEKVHDQYSAQPKPVDESSPPTREMNYVLNKLPIQNPSPPMIEINYVLNKLPIRQGENDGQNVDGGPITKPENQLLTSGVPSHYDQLHLGVKIPIKDESSIDILPVTTSEIQVPTLGSAGQDSTSFEILKSIVYGGLMEVIASLSVVASAAAGDATTLNIIALALANLVGGIFVIGHNLWDLKDDCYKFSTQETSNQESRNKYKELLGSVEHFPMHVFFAILSFLVFGIIPPLAYGYSFHETNDKDFTMVIVAAASFACVGLLAIFKAYIDRCTGFSGYIKTITYYLTTAVAVSGVSYAVGNLVKRLIEEFGLFETGSEVAMAVLPRVMSTNPSLAYY